MGRLFVYYGDCDSLHSLKKSLSLSMEYISYSDYDFGNVSDYERYCIGGYNKIVLYTFAKFVSKAEHDAKSFKVTAAFVDSFISYLDWSVDAVKCISALLEYVNVYLFTTKEKDIESLGKLPTSIFRVEERFKK